MASLRLPPIGNPVSVRSVPITGFCTRSIATSTVTEVIWLFGGLRDTTLPFDGDTDVPSPSAILEETLFTVQHVWAISFCIGPSTTVPQSAQGALNLEAAFPAFYWGRILLICQRV